MRDLREPADDLAPTLRDLGDLSPDLEQLFRDIDPLIDASETGVPAAERFLEGAEPLLESTHVLHARAQPDPVLPVATRTARSPSSSRSAARALAGNGEGGYQARRRAPSTTCRRSAIIDGRSFQQRADRPPWERANAYVAPNAYDRADRRSA